MTSAPAPATPHVARFHRLNGPYHTLRRIVFLNDWHLVHSALHLAIELHDGQPRESGGPYIYHPIRVALKLWTLGIREEYIFAAALLHDVIEDRDDRLTIEVQRRLYSLNADTVAIVRLLTKRKDRHNDNLYFARIATRWEAALVKLADRLDNLATMNGAFTKKRARKYVDETRQYVLPLAQQGVNGSDPQRRAFDALRRQLQCAIAKANEEFNLKSGHTATPYTGTPSRAA